MRAVTLQQLRAFAVVAKHLSFNKAADELCLTPPAVSMQIKGLEQALRVQLFRREGNRVDITLPGEHLLFYTQRVLSTLKQAEMTMAGIRGAVHGPLTIGMVSSCNYFLPGVLARFLEEHPCVEPRLVVSKRHLLIDMLQSRALDLAVVARPPEESTMRIEPFAPLRNVIVAAPTHPLASRRRAEPAALRDCRFIVRQEGSATRAAMECFLLAHDLRVPYAMEVGSNEAVKQAVRAGLGVGFLPMHAVKLECEVGALKVIDIGDHGYAHRWHIAYPTNHLLSAIAEAFRYYLLEHGRALVEDDLRPVFEAYMSDPVPVTATASVPASHNT
jgi:DNA-binding transcriptional LysR family regulator